MAEIDLEHVSKRYPDGTLAVDDFNLSVAEGEFIVMVGPSGCGKSTVLNMVAGLEDVTEGTLRVDGDVVNDLAPRERDIAMVFQSYALYPHMTVRQNIGFPLKLAGVERASAAERVAEVARLLELTAHLDRMPARLSGGQRQRVAMGRAMVRRPRAFLMDEPLSNLDARLRVQMRRQVARIRATLATTTLYVTHDQSEAMTLGERLVVMRRGVVQQVGQPRRVYDRPANVFVAGFIGSPAMNFLPASVEDGVLHSPLGDVRLPGDVGGLAREEDPSPGQRAGRAPALRAAPTSRDVIVGVRPEHFEWAPLAGERPGGRIRASVDAVEALGSDVFVHVTLPGTWANSLPALDAAADSGDAPAALDAAADSGDAPAAGEGVRVVARLDPAADVAEGGVVDLWYDTGAIHIFDAASGTRLSDPAPGARVDNPPRGH